MKPDIRALLLTWNKPGFRERLVSKFAERDATITTLRTWLREVEWAVEWTDMDGPDLCCPMCGHSRTAGHDPQCNWIEDRAALGEATDGQV